MTPRPIRCAIAVAIIAAISCKDSTAPDVLHIDTVLPSGWLYAGVNATTYVLGLDHQTVHGGHAALAILGSDTSQARFRGIVQSIKADDYRGKRVRLSAWVRQTDVRGSDIGLWMRIDGPGVMQGFDNFSSRPLIGTSDWHQVEVILDVPTDAIGISLGALMSGSGLFRVDDLRLEVVPDIGPTTNLLVDFPPIPDPSSQYAGRPRAPTNLDFEQQTSANP